VERHPLHVQPFEQLGGEVKTGGRSCGGAFLLDQLDWAVAPTCPQPFRRPREPFPQAILTRSLQQQDLAAWMFDPDPRRNHPRVVDDDKLVRGKLVGQLAEPAVADFPARPVVDEQPRVVAAFQRPLSDQFRRQRVIELGELHPIRTLALRPMNPVAIERANERLRQAAEGRTEPAVVEATLERARHQVESLAETAAQLEATLPDRIGEAVQDGLRKEVLPVAKHLAEVRGLSANTVRRLERLDADLLAERHARVDDLALLVDLIVSGWQGVDERLARLERALGADEGAIVYRIEDRRSGT
jgi:hypothetical protein